MVQFLYFMKTWARPSLRESLNCTDRCPCSQILVYWNLVPRSRSHLTGHPSSVTCCMTPVQRQTKLVLVSRRNLVGVQEKDQHPCPGSVGYGPIDEVLVLVTEFHVFFPLLVSMGLCHEKLLHISFSFYFEERCRSRFRTGPEPLQRNFWTAISSSCCWKIFWRKFLTYIPSHLM